MLAGARLALAATGEQREIRRRVDGEKARGKVYVSDPADAPPGVQVQQGPRGGLFYAVGAVFNRAKPGAVAKQKPAPKGRAGAKPKATPKPKPEKPAKRKPGEPFSGAGDERLPQRIRNESEANRAKWVSVFNGTLRKGGSEADAVAAANSTLPKRNAKPASTKPPRRKVGEPFGGATDPNLPNRIQAESPTVRAQWVSAFNANLARGSEADAVAAANRVLPDRRQPKPDRTPTPRRGTKGATDVGEMTIDCEHLAGEKCAMCETAMAAPMMDHYQPFGGATSFDEIDKWRASQKVREDVDALADSFEAITRNVWANEMLSLAEKAAAIASAAADLKARLGEPVDDAEMLDEEADDDGEKSVRPLSRLRRLFVGEKAAPTKSEGGVAYRAGDYADVADESKPSTWKLRLAEGRPGNVTVAQVARAITALQPGGFRGQKVELGSSKSTVVSRISSAIDRAKGDDASKANLRKRLAGVKEFEWRESPLGTFTAFKDDVTDEWRWLAVFSNRFEDREGETFSEEAHREFEAYVDRTGDYPELRLWHVPGSRLGVADEIAYDDRGFMLAAGRYDAGQERAAKALADAGPLGVSHGYMYRPSDLVGGVFRRYRSFEISPLPMSAAANQLTGYHAGAEDDTMPMRPEKRAFLDRILGAEKAKAVEDAIGELADKAAAEGIAYKDLAEMLEPVAAGTNPPAQPAATGQAPTATSPAAGDGEATKEAILASVKAALEPITVAINGINAKLEAQAGEISSMKEASGNANLWRPRAQPGAKAASASGDNVVDPRDGSVSDAQAGAREGGHMDYYLSVMGIGGKADDKTPAGAQP